MKNKYTLPALERAAALCGATVVALATIMASSYNTAHCLLERAGRVHGEGFNLWQWLYRSYNQRTGVIRLLT